MAKDVKAMPAKKTVDTNKEPTAAQEEIGIEIPVNKTNVLAGHHCSSRIDLHLSERQAKALRCVLDGLNVAGKRLKNGDFVARNNDTIRYLLDDLADRLQIDVE